MKKVSIKDIARELGISITTVSFVINGKSQEMGISEATATRVHELIKKMGYNPNSAARMLRTGKSKTIGLIVEDISNYFFGNVAKIIEVEANKNGYNVFFSSTENDDNTARELISKMKKSSVDGYIITPTFGLKDEILKLKKENIPFVLLDRFMQEVDTNYVVLDNYTGAFDLAKHLLDNGYGNIGYISIHSQMTQMTDRERGFNDALESSNIAILPENIFKVNFEDSNELIVEKIKQYILQHPQLDALFFATNYLGVAGIEAIQQAGLLIGSDIGVVCFDDNDIFRLLNPSITVSAQPIKEIATESINLLLSVINNVDIHQQTVGKILLPTVIQRNSSNAKIAKKVN
jgi:LacI family transcriptional regulator